MVEVVGRAALGAEEEEEEEEERPGRGREKGRDGARVERRGER